MKKKNGAPSLKTDNKNGSAANLAVKPNSAPRHNSLNFHLTASEATTQSEKKKLPLFTYVNTGYGRSGFFRKPSKNEMKEVKRKTEFFVAIDEASGTEGYINEMAEMYKDNRAYQKVSNYVVLKQKNQPDNETYLENSRPFFGDKISEELFKEIKQHLGLSNRVQTGIIIELLHHIMSRAVKFRNNHYAPKNTPQYIFAKFNIAN